MRSGRSQGHAQAVAYHSTAKSRLLSWPLAERSTKNLPHGGFRKRIDRLRQRHLAVRPSPRSYAVRALSKQLVISTILTRASTSMIVAPDWSDTASSDPCLVELPAAEPVVAHLCRKRVGCADDTTRTDLEIRLTCAWPPWSSRGEEGVDGIINRSCHSTRTGSSTAPHVHPHGVY